jgi:hypothetical protein
MLQIGQIYVILIFMDNLERLRGTYDESRRQLEEKRAAVINVAGGLKPEDITDRIEQSEDDGEYSHETQWICVADPADFTDTPKGIEVLPIIDFARGSDETNKDAEPFAYRLLLLGRTSTGEEILIGEMIMIPGFEPTLLLNFNNENDTRAKVDWESKDAEIFLTLATSALERVS